MTLQPLKATVITDASYCHTTQAGGYGAWITMDSGTQVPLRVRKGGRLKGYPSNPAHAELLAALNGMWFAYTRGARRLLLQTDNLAVVHIINGQVGPKQRSLRDEYVAAQATHFADAVIHARHVKGHSRTQDARSFVNRWCDHEAGVHMRALRAERTPEFKNVKGIRT
jgi:ribonuclease HI